jgi:hypothetical protein
MQTIKRVVIFLLVAVGIFVTVEWISYKDEVANNWGLNRIVQSNKGKTGQQTAWDKTSNVQACQKSKTSAL